MPAASQYSVERAISNDLVLAEPDFDDCALSPDVPILALTVALPKPVGQGPIPIAPLEGWQYIPQDPCSIEERDRFFLATEKIDLPSGSNSTRFLTSLHPCWPRRLVIYLSFAVLSK